MYTYIYGREYDRISLGRSRDDGDHESLLLPSISTHSAHFSPRRSHNNAFVQESIREHLFLHKNMLFHVIGTILLEYFNCYVVTVDVLSRDKSIEQFFP